MQNMLRRASSLVTYSIYVVRIFWWTAMFQYCVSLNAFVINDIAYFNADKSCVQEDWVWHASRAVFIVEKSKIWLMKNKTFQMCLYSLEQCIAQVKGTVCFCIEYGTLSCTARQHSHFSSAPRKHEWGEENFPCVHLCACIQCLRCHEGYSRVSGT